MNDYCSSGMRMALVPIFYEDGKPHFYCRGYYDSETGIFLKCCRRCSKWCQGKQAEIDYSKYMEKLNG